MVRHEEQTEQKSIESVLSHLLQLVVGIWITECFPESTPTLHVPSDNDSGNGHNLHLHKKGFVATFTHIHAPGSEEVLKQHAT